MECLKSMSDDSSLISAASMTINPAPPRARGPVKFQELVDYVTAECVVEVHDRPDHPVRQRDRSYEYGFE
jgi:hypothetical protein